MRPVGLTILAAGGSHRLGTPKQLLRDSAGRSLLRRAAQTALASAGRPVVVVLGAAADAARHEIADLAVSIVVNPDWKTGLASSLKVGIAALTAESSLDAVIVMLCDQPLVDAALLDSLIAAYQETGHEIVACEYGDVVGVPALFGRSLFGALAGLDGDEGARKIIRGHRGPIIRIPFPGGIVDIDMPADLNGLGAAPAAQDSPAPS